MDISNAIKSKMKNFTRGIRYGDSNNKVIEIYRDFIIHNISNVLENTFPYFSSYLPLDLKDQIIKIFLEQNSSFDPAFHQIATELLRCSKRIKMPEQLSKLMEFEWLLFSIEISESKIFKSNKVNEDIKFSDIKKINVNPTLKLISLPFDANNLDYNVDVIEKQLYIVYRNLDHYTYYQKISPIEFAMISSILEKGVKVFELTDFKNLEDNYKKYLIEKLVIWNNENVVALSI